MCLLSGGENRFKTQDHKTLSFLELTVASASGDRKKRERSKGAIKRVELRDDVGLLGI